MLSRHRLPTAWPFKIRTDDTGYLLANLWIRHEISFTVSTKMKKIRVIYL